ncbi:MAG TPA: hypothetical protein VHM01_17720 [Alphaproteobacteria bacterium]|nr:hypothetical protein [Alphaproteobacteria bacterium]
MNDLRLVVLVMVVVMLVLVTVPAIIVVIIDEYEGGCWLVARLEAGGLSRRRAQCKKHGAAEGWRTMRANPIRPRHETPSGKTTRTAFGCFLREKNVQL